MFSRIVPVRTVAIAKRCLAPLAAFLALVALPPAARAGDTSPQKLMQFGTEAAKDGLWREATLRWERALKADPSNARLYNNLAVAYESAGRLEEADHAYREARRLDPERKAIRENHESFLKLHPEFLEAPPGQAAPAGEAPHAS
ncbi:MAG TPA: tetratricopeptide repeat protein [Dongiaceae bacterium]|nr:tetratricopeptide repeat protein [Dongiaceae bacterium]